MKPWEADEKHWDELNRQQKERVRRWDFSDQYVQPWERKSSPGSTQDQWNALYKNALEEKQQITVAPWQTSNYEDPRFLEHDNNITGPVYKYTPFDDGDVRETKFLRRHPTITFQVAGWEAIRKGVNKIPFVNMGHGDDTSGDAIRFATAGGIGRDRGGVALEVYQKFDRYQIPEKKGWFFTEPSKEYKSGDGTEVNAARHTLWNMINTNRFGINMAKEIADLHEANPYADTDERIFDPDDYKESSTNPNPRRCQFEKKEKLRPEKCALSDADAIADLLNNRIGRNLGLGYASGTSAQELALAMLDYYYHYGLYRVDKIGGKYEVVKSKIKKEQYDYLKQVYTNEVDSHGHPIRPDGYIPDFNISPLLWKKNQI
ncbi:DUF6973 domain-containing protein [Commensalibacter papalotli (ex Servin-Garciduenas et al. 2014)]|uniref:DUF6973 domain-containing protein n=1 Tax=Commensalibacter papalotli (ex Servin-Garciduenas et al. 2014) TaxID=1208583 RepID=W7DJ88_9PROT|nr:hypothetical protein [Commensalibacter papalotli (ex Servin-Garciduenas et al. 2014)]EUK17407.1 hypothetical protein COMX_10435 [Commensalibacter papalotli (ex Servin-Garciduenas et al. 2014)]